MLVTLHETSEMYPRATFVLVLPSSVTDHVPLTTFETRVTRLCPPYTTPHDGGVIYNGLSRIVVGVPAGRDGHECGDRRLCHSDHVWSLHAVLWRGVPDPTSGCGRGGAETKARSGSGRLFW